MDALGHRRDPSHPEIKTFCQGLRDQRVPVYTSDYVRDEVITLLFRHVERLVGARAAVRYEPRHPADVPATWADIRKAERLLGWRPTTPFEDGVENLVAWYTRNRTWANEVRT
jgi:nucleoside-diphosphate-sugar epimerase